MVLNKMDKDFVQIDANVISIVERKGPLTYKLYMYLVDLMILTNLYELSYLDHEKKDPKKDLDLIVEYRMAKKVEQKIKNMNSDFHSYVYEFSEKTLNKYEKLSPHKEFKQFNHPYERIRKINEKDQIRKIYEEYAKILVRCWIFNTLGDAESENEGIAICSDLIHYIENENNRVMVLQVIEVL